MTANGRYNSGGGNQPTRARTVLLALTCLVAGGVAMAATPAVAQVCVIMPYTCTPYTCVPCTMDPTQNCPQSQEIYNEVTQHTEDRFEEHEDWMVDDLFLRDILPQMKMMTEQLSAVALQQVSIIGTFLDAKHQLEVHRGARSGGGTGVQSEWWQESPGHSNQAHEVIVFSTAIDSDAWLTTSSYKAPCAQLPLPVAKCQPDSCSNHNLLPPASQHLASYL